MPAQKRSNRSPLRARAQHRRPPTFAAQASIISVTVLDDAQVREVVCGAARDSVDRTARHCRRDSLHYLGHHGGWELADICQQRGVLLVDAPISGAVPAAQRRAGWQ